MIVIGHRGSSGIAPENTSASMELAVKQGCQGIETDLQLTKDGEIVVFHDWSVERTTDGTGEIKDLTLEELLTLDAGSWFSKKFENEKILSLESLLNILPNDLLLNLEIKSRAWDNRGIEEKVVKILEENNRLENTVISSFNHKCIERVGNLNPKIKLGFLYEAYFVNLEELLETSKLDMYSIHPNYNYVDKDLIEKAHKNDLKVYSWTVNDIKSAQRLKDLGIDGIITNFPQLFA